jgi:uncharacterized protein (TIGR02246 family)
MISKILVCFSAVTVWGLAATPDPEIRAVMERQAADWNRGDTDAFLEGYAPDAIFVGDAVSRGLEDLRARYKKRYPTPDAMGHLTFSEVEVHPLDKDHAFVIGKWKLERKKEAGGDVGGVYTLVFKKTAKGWKVILDHTT